MRRPRQNGDEGRRRREREAEQAGTVEGQARVLTDRLRSGQLQPWHVGALSSLGYEPALVLDTTIQPLHPFRRNWDSALTLLFRRTGQDGLFPAAPDGGIGLKKQFLRVAGIGAALVSERLLYLPHLHRLLDAHIVSEYTARLPITELHAFASLVATEGTHPDAYVGVGASEEPPLSVEARRLRDLRTTVGRALPDEAWSLTHHIGALPSLCALMRDQREERAINFYLEQLFGVLGALEGGVLGALQEDREQESGDNRPVVSAIFETQNMIAAAEDSDPPRYWTIRGNGATDYWSNEDGWTWSSQNATVFTWSGRKEYSLPSGGEWFPGRPVYDVHAVGALLRQGAADLLIRWLLTGPAAQWRIGDPWEDRPRASW